MDYSFQITNFTDAAEAGGKSIQSSRIKVQLFIEKTVFETFMVFLDGHTDVSDFEDTPKRIRRKKMIEIALWKELSQLEGTYVDENRLGGKMHAILNRVRSNYATLMKQRKAFSPKSNDLVREDSIFWGTIEGWEYDTDEEFFQFI